MFRSLKLGTLFGIDLYVHQTFWLLPLFVFFSDLASGYGLGGVVFNVLFVFAVFACVVLHELGHALAARGYGIGTRHITLYPIGGVAALDRMPEQPGREIGIALAGPAVNVVIATVLGFVLLLGGVELTPTLGTTSRNPLAIFGAAVLGGNVFLCLFNLLPAFPMDGGRVLRALLALRLTRLRATEIAAGVGTLVAAGFLIFGLVNGQFFLMFLAATVFMLGQAELTMVRAREAGRLMRGRAEEYDRPDYEEPDGTAPHGDRPPSPRFSGLAWDAARGGWVEWRNGVLVKPLHHGR